MKFTDLELHPQILAGIEAQNYVDCTPIQAAAIPHLLNGLDLAGLAQTGTGKTAAFLIPMMDRVIRSIEAAKARQESQPTAVNVDTVPTDEPVVSHEASSTENTAEASQTPADTTPEANKRPIFENWRGSHFVLILVPTRELAEQVSESARKLGGPAGLKVAAIYGGTSYEGQKAALKKGVQFVVATPGRLIDLFKEHLIDLTQVRAVIFDEADRMFDMGFKDDMVFILRRIPKDRQFLVFSATLNFDVLNTAYEFGAHPVEVNVSRDQAKAENVSDELYHVGQQEKPQFLISLVQKHKPRQAIIFSNFKHNVERIAKFLTANGHPAMAISSLLTQAQRNRVMELFKADNEKNILVATDLAARGLDIKGVDLVVNFELPDDPENYVHRIGRTGRAGATGLALSLVSDRDVEALARIENYLDHKIKVGWLEDNEIVQEFKPFPQEEVRPRFASKESNANRDNSRRFDRNKSGARSERGPRPERQDRGQKTGAQGQSRDQRRPQEQRPQNQQAGQQAHGGPKHRHTHRPGATPAAPMSLGAKIKLFFKKLFGGGSAKAQQTADKAAAQKMNGQHRHHGGDRKHGHHRHHGRDHHRRHGGGRRHHGHGHDQKARVNPITPHPADPNKQKN